VAGFAPDYSPGAYLVYPTQNSIITDGRPAPPFVEPDSTYYSSSSRYNGNILEIESLTNYMGYHMVRLKISPLQYIASDSLLIYFTTIAFTINYQISGTDPLIKKMTEHQYDGIIDYISKTIENPQDINSFGPICNTLEDNYDGTLPLNLFFLPGAGGNVIEYLIITNDDLKDSFEELAEWKTSKGIPALVVTTSQIEEYYPGFDLAEKIFNYLKDVFNNWNAVYVLVGGDTDIIPARVVLNDIGGLRVSDLYYADVADDNNPDYCWDYNHNGDFTDDDAYLDLEADLFVGRAPVSSPIEATNFISKILYYEQNTFPDQYKNISLIGAYLCACHDTNDPPKNVLGMRDWWNPVTDAGLIPNDFFITKIYDDPVDWNGDMELNYQNVLRALDDNIDIAEQQHIIAHTDHSGFNSIGTSVNCKRQSLSFSELDNLTYTNGSIYKIIFGTSCESNEFDKDCFAEHCLTGSGIDNEHNGIAIAYIGNSGLGEAHEYGQGYKFFYSLYEIPKVNLGKIFKETRKASTQKSYLKKLNFLGDPELPVWTDSLSDLAIQTIPGSLTVGENQLEVIVNGLQSGEEATVCIQKENEVYGVQTTETYENIHKAIFLDCKPDSEGSLQIFATAPNHHYTEKSVAVNSKPDVHLYIEDISPVDYYLIRGENDFKLVLANAGSTVTATHIETTLSSLSEFVEISPFNPPVSGFEDIEHGQMQESNDSYSITVSDEAGDLAFIWLQLDIECDQGDFTEKFVLQVKAAEITYRGNKIITTSGSGNDDIFIDPGEIVSFKVELLNSGCLSAKSISASISKDSDYIEDIIIGTVYFREMSAHDTAWCNDIFKVQIVNDLPPVAFFNLTLNINYDGIDHSFPITIGNELKPEDLSFTSTDSYISLKWTHHIYNSYNIYKLDPDDLPPGKDIEDSTYYQRLNFYINQASSFIDINVDPAKVYYYKVTKYANDKLSQGPYTPAFKAWTSLTSLEPWPVSVQDNGVSNEGSPILYNAIPIRNASENPEMEIFFPMSGGYDENGLKSALYAFYSTGDELYDIDQNVNTHAGFVNFNGVRISATPIIGEMNENDDFGEVAFATSEGPGQIPPDLKKVFLFSAGDNPQDPDGYPDKLWEVTLTGQAVNSALVGAKVIESPQADIKIFAAEIWHGVFDIRNSSDGSSYESWQVLQAKNLGIPVVCDLT
jgi:hypothetical protein